MFKDKNTAMARSIAERVSDAGGRSFFVGGIVRDHILGYENKDVDIEIHGITPQALQEILKSLGEVIKMGASFGVFGLKSFDIDIAMPRKEKAVGRGHKDFEVFVDPFIGQKRVQSCDLTNKKKHHSHLRCFFDPRGQSSISLCTSLFFILWLYGAVESKVHPGRLFHPPGALP